MLPRPISPCESNSVWPCFLDWLVIHIFLECPQGPVFCDDSQNSLWVVVPFILYFAFTVTREKNSRFAATFASAPSSTQQVSTTWGTAALFAPTCQSLLSLTNCLILPTLPLRFDWRTLEVETSSAESSKRVQKITLMVTHFTIAPGILGRSRSQPCLLRVWLREFWTRFQVIFPGWLEPGDATDAECFFLAGTTALLYP